MQRRRHGHKDGTAKPRRRRHRGAAGAEARMPKAREWRRRRRRSPPSRVGGLGERRKLPQRGPLANFVHFICYFMHSEA